MPTFSPLIIDSTTEKQKSTGKAFDFDIILGFLVKSPHKHDEGEADFVWRETKTLFFYETLCNRMQNGVFPLFCVLRDDRQITSCQNVVTFITVML